jgi:ADP-heptose:LPS heptosyltransferase
MDWITHTDCLHFRGDVPCKPHKSHGVHCVSCDYYQKISKRILIIKLGAIGDVIRTTPLVVYYKNRFPNCKITWLTWTPEILPQQEIHEILRFDFSSVMYVKSAEFDIAINLDKEKEACALLKEVNAEEKYGYTLSGNVASPVNANATHKFMTGVFDDVSKANTKSYCEEIFEICGLEYAGQPYLLDTHDDKGFEWDFIDKSKPVIGLNTGCGGRWTTRLWPEAHFVSLSKRLLDDGYEVLLLGGEQEHERNTEISYQSGAKYKGYYSLERFIHLINQCDLVVTQVTMAMHLTLGLGKKIVLMNNIFNPHEFDVFGRGSIVMPDMDCECFYLGKCRRGESCMHQLPVDKVHHEIKNWI